MVKALRDKVVKNSIGVIYDINKSKKIVMEVRKEKKVKVLGRNIRVDNSSDEEDWRFISDLLKETEPNKNNVVLGTQAQGKP